MVEVKISTEYIQLNQFLKFVDLIGSGGETRLFLETHDVYLNDVEVYELRKKIYPGHQLRIDDKIYLIVSDNNVKKN